MERVNAQKSLILKETETYYTKGTLNTWIRFKRLEACDSINFVDMKKSLAWLTSALLLYGLGYVPLKSLEGNWFLNNANGR